MPVKEWEAHYQECGFAHRRQNTRITGDFAKSLPEGSRIREVLDKALWIIEIGCGTGELAAWVARKFAPVAVLGIDLSKTAIRMASRRYGGLCAFEAWDYRDVLEKFDLVVSSNTLEHFSDPIQVLHDWLHIAPLALLLIPYRETETLAENDRDGGINHSASLDEAALQDFEILDTFLFESAGWQNRKDSRQWAVLVREHHE